MLDDGESCAALSAIVLRLRDHMDLVGQNAFVIDESSLIEYVIELAYRLVFPPRLGRMIHTSRLLNIADCHSGAVEFYIFLCFSFRFDFCAPIDLITCSCFSKPNSADNRINFAVVRTAACVIKSVASLRRLRTKKN